MSEIKGKEDIHHQKQTEKSSSLCHDQTIKKPFYDISVLEEGKVVTENVTHHKSMSESLLRLGVGIALITLFLMAAIQIGLIPKLYFSMMDHLSRPDLFKKDYVIIYFIHIWFSVPLSFVTVALFALGLLKVWGHDLYGWKYATTAAYGRFHKQLGYYVFTIFFVVTILTGYVLILWRPGGSLFWVKIVGFIAGLWIPPITIIAIIYMRKYKRLNMHVILAAYVGAFILWTAVGERGVQLIVNHSSFTVFGSPVQKLETFYSVHLVSMVVLGSLLLVFIGFIVVEMRLKVKK